MDVLSNDTPGGIDAPERGLPPIPHPLECAPRRRPARKPVWLPKRDRRDAPHLHPRKSRDEGWHSPVIRFADDGEAVRINFTYRNGGTSTSGRMSIKAGCNQYCEGPHEKNYFRILETDCDTYDFQFQIACFEWRTSGGLIRRYFVDGGRQAVSGEIRFFEIKSHQAYFHDPETADRLEEAEKVLAKHDIALDRIVGQDLVADGILLAMANEVYADRMTRITDAQVASALECIEREGGIAPLRKVQESIHPDPRHARAIANAMLVWRQIAFRLDTPVTGDTAVCPPRTPPAGARSLRSLSLRIR
jgi:hypothetical protein